jgi:hypothetical protein
VILGLSCMFCMSFASISVPCAKIIYIDAPSSNDDTFIQFAIRKSDMCMYLNASDTMTRNTMRYSISVLWFQ